MSVNLQLISVGAPVAIRRWMRPWMASLMDELRSCPTRAPVRSELSGGHAASWRRRARCRQEPQTRLPSDLLTDNPALSGVPTTERRAPVRPGTSHHGGVPTALLPDESRADGSARWSACTGSDAGQLGGSSGAVATAGGHATRGS